MMREQDITTGAWIIFVAACALVGCQVAPMFDSTAFANLDQVAASAVDFKVNCSAMSQDKIHTGITFPALLAHESAAAMAHSQDYENATGKLDDMAATLEGFYAGGAKPSETFCEMQLDDIHAGAKAILKTYGGRN